MEGIQPSDAMGHVRYKGQNPRRLGQWESKSWDEGDGLEKFKLKPSYEDIGGLANSVYGIPNINHEKYSTANFLSKFEPKEKR